MSTPPARLLRDALSDIADETKPAELLGPALDRGRRLRRRRTATTVAGGAVTVLVLIGAGVAVTTPGGRSAPPTAGVLSSPSVVSSLPATPLVVPSRFPDLPQTVSGPVRLPGGWLIASGDRWVYNRVTHRYQRVDGFELTVPPAGTTVLIGNQNGGMTLFDLRTSARQSVPNPGRVQSPQWSPDGTRLLLSTTDKDTDKLGFVVVDGRTGAQQKHIVGRATYTCDVCQFTWLPSGTEVALPILDTTVPRDYTQLNALVRGIQLFSVADGTPTRFLSIPGWPAGPFSWSPDGRYVVIVDTSSRMGDNVLVDLDTGARHPFLSGTPYWISNDQLLVSPYSSEVLLVDRDGRTVQTFHVPRQLWESPNQGLPVTLAPE